MDSLLLFLTNLLHVYTHVLITTSLVYPLTESILPIVYNNSHNTRLYYSTTSLSKSPETYYQLSNQQVLVLYTINRMPLYVYLNSLYTPDIIHHHPTYI